MKRFLAEYILYIYLNFIKFDEYEIYKKKFVPFIKSVIFVRAIYMWIASIILFPIFIIGMIIEKNKQKILENILLKIKNIYFN